MKLMRIDIVEHQRLECEKQESEKRNLYLKKIRLESAINQRQNSQDYTKIEMIVKQQVNKVLQNGQQLLKLAFESISESLLKDPFRLQSFSSMPCQLYLPFLALSIHLDLSIIRAMLLFSTHL